MKNPSPMALKKRDLAPTPPTRENKKRGAQAVPAIAEARKYIDTSTNAGAASISPDKPLTEKQKQFVKFWAQGESIQTASLRAGYNDGASIAYRMTMMPNILKLKAQYEAEWIEENQMTRKRVMDGMLEAIEMAKLMSEPATMVAGWREVGKLCGYYAPVESRVRVDVTGNVVIDKMNSMTDAELLKIITTGTTRALEYVEDITNEADQGTDAG